MFLGTHGFMFSRKDDEILVLTSLLNESLGIQLENCIPGDGSSCLKIRSNLSFIDMAGRSALKKAFRQIKEGIQIDLPKWQGP
jgi:hypothetical protein